MPTVHVSERLKVAPVSSELDRVAPDKERLVVAFPQTPDKLKAPAVKSRERIHLQMNYGWGCWPVELNEVKWN